MTISYADVLAAAPEVEHIDRAKVDTFIEIANLGFPNSRFKGGSAATGQRGRVLYVLHMLNLPAFDINAPHVRAQMGTPKPMGKKPHPWDGTSHGQQLKTMVKEERAVPLLRPAGR